MTKEDVIQNALTFGDYLLRRRIKNFSQSCESPIEELFATALVCNHWPHPEPIAPMLYGAPYTDPPKFDGLHVYPQSQVGKFRADFLFVYSVGGELTFTVVECDGHDFHERTKEQAARDRSRDRQMTALGYKVLRFTGSEIFASPGERAWDAVMIAQGLSPDD